MFDLIRPNGSLGTFCKTSSWLLFIIDSFDVTCMLFELSRFFKLKIFALIFFYGLWISLLPELFSIIFLFFIKAWSFSCIFYCINPAATPVTKAVLLFFAGFKSTFSSSFFVGSLFDEKFYLICVRFSCLRSD